MIFFAKLCFFKSEQGLLAPLLQRKIRCPSEHCCLCSKKQARRQSGRNHNKQENRQRHPTQPLPQNNQSRLAVRFENSSRERQLGFCFCCKNKNKVSKEHSNRKGNDRRFETVGRNWTKVKITALKGQVLGVSTNEKNTSCCHQFLQKTHFASLPADVPFLSDLQRLCR